MTKLKDLVKYKCSICNGTGWNTKNKQWCRWCKGKGFGQFLFIKEQTNDNQKDN